MTLPPAALALLGPLAEAADAIAADLVERDAVRRTFAVDHTLWRDDPTELADRLGWIPVVEEVLAGLSDIRDRCADLTTDPNTATLIVDEAINKVTTLRGRLGAYQKTTLETNVATLTDTLSNLTEAESAIRDADFAAESAKLTRAQILTQSTTSVLAIANSNPQNVLALLGR